MRPWSPQRSYLILLTAAVVSLVGVRTDCQPGVDHYAAKIQRTTYGIPHIYAEDWGGLGYGYGYAFAQDNFCVFAREIVAANGDASRYFGPGGGRLEDDLFFKFWARDAVAQEFFDRIEPDLQDLARGYAAGFNRYLRETGVANLPEACRDAAWVREIDILDLFKVYAKLVDRAGASNLTGLIIAAVPPTGSAAAPESAAAELARVAAQTPAQWKAQANLPVLKPEEIGSNMVAVGRDVTETGTGMLLVNPHFPWSGPLRFYQVHVTIPGVIDSMGGSLFGSPLPNIAFNENVAWSHTVSAASRFVLRQIAPVPGDPLSYLVDGVPVAMEPHPVSVQVLQPDGSLATESHTFSDTQFGPVLAIPPLLLWTSGLALTVEDPARDNYRIFDLFLRMNTANSLDEFVQALEEEVALPWVNTVATDRTGEVYYGDVGTVPHVTDALIAECSTALTALVENFGLVLLDGTRSECALGTDPDSPQPGIFGASNLPSLRRSDWVQNSNDSYWLSHPDQPLEGFSPLLGGEREVLSLRTRLGIRQLMERVTGSDGLPGNQFDLAAVQNLVTANRNLSAELYVDDILTLCAEEPNLVNGVDVGPACAVLAGWSRRNDVDAVGALVWRVVLPRINDVRNLFAVPFDADDPLNTPREFRLSDPAVRTDLMEALAEGVQFLADNALPIDAAWGDVHFDEKLGMRIPIHGGPGGHGIYNAISTRFRSGAGYAPITGGSSIVMAIQFPKKGGVEARGVLTYSQSADPENPHHADQTLLFSQEGWNDLPFSPGEIRANRISKIEIAEPR